MPKPYSEDLRERVIEAVESGASRREAAENFRLSPSSAVRWWRRWHDTGTAKAKPSGGSKSPLEEHAEWLLRLVAEQPDLTLDEIVAAMRKRRIPGSRTAAWRFFERHNLTYKKSTGSRQLPCANEVPSVACVLTPDHVQSISLRKALNASAMRSPASSCKKCDESLNSTVRCLVKVRSNRARSAPGPSAQCG